MESQHFDIGMIKTEQCSSQYRYSAVGCVYVYEQKQKQSKKKRKTRKLRNFSQIKQKIKVSVHVF